MHEHPYTASNWEIQEIWKFVSETGVYFVEDNRSEPGAVLPSQGEDGKAQPIRSHSGFLTNSEEIAKNLNAIRLQDRDKGDLKLVTSFLEGLMKQMETHAKRGKVD